MGAPICDQGCLRRRDEFQKGLDSAFSQRPVRKHAGDYIADSIMDSILDSIFGPDDDCRLKTVSRTNRPRNREEQSLKETVDQQRQKALDYLSDRP